MKLLEKLSKTVDKLLNPPSHEYLGIEEQRDLVDLIAEYWESDDYEMFAIDDHGRRCHITRDEAVDAFGNANYEEYLFTTRHPQFTITKEEAELYNRSW